MQILEFFGLCNVLTRSGCEQLCRIKKNLYIHFCHFIFKFIHVLKPLEDIVGPFMEQCIHKYIGSLKDIETLLSNMLIRKS